MAISVTQAGVAKGMAFAMTLCVATIFYGVYLDPFGLSAINDFQGRAQIFGLSIILPTLFMFVSIGRMARFRFFSPDEIDGSGLTKGSEDSLVLQSLLQNTLEQVVLAMAVYLAWCFLMPVSMLSAVPLCAVIFALGRILFFRGYTAGAASRAVGFALTFYSSALLFLCLILHEAWRLLG